MKANLLRQFRTSRGVAIEYLPFFDKYRIEIEGVCEGGGKRGEDLYSWQFRLYDKFSQALWQSHRVIRLQLDDVKCRLGYEHKRKIYP